MQNVWVGLFPRSLFSLCSGSWNWSVGQIFVSRACGKKRILGELNFLDTLLCIKMLNLPFCFFKTTISCWLQGQNNYCWKYRWVFQERGVTILRKSWFGTLPMIPLLDLFAPVWLHTMVSLLILCCWPNTSPRNTPGKRSPTGYSYKRKFLFRSILGVNFMCIICGPARVWHRDVGWLVTKNLMYIVSITFRLSRFPKRRKRKRQNLF